MGAQELTEVGLLFRAKLRQLREAERHAMPVERQRPAPARRRARREAFETEPPSDRLFRRGELAAMLDVHPNTVSRWATAEGLPSFRRRAPPLPLGRRARVAGRSSASPVGRLHG